MGIPTLWVGEDIVWSSWRHVAGVIAHRVLLTTTLDKTFDGDTASATVVVSDRSLEVSKRYLKTRPAWVALDGSLRASSNYDTVQLMTRALTGRNEAV